MDKENEKKEYLEEWEEELEEEKGIPDTFRKVIKSVVAFMVIAGLVYFSGIYQFLFYKETHPGITERDLESLLDAERIVLPAQAFIFENDESLGSNRDSDDIERMFLNADIIWRQANISFDLEDISHIELKDNEIRNFLNSPQNIVSGFDAYDPEKISVFFMRSLEGINGIAFPGLRIAAVADLTSIYDFRVLAHEIGHLLGLGHHYTDRNMLMHESTNGVKLNFDEIKTSRKRALLLLE